MAVEKTIGKILYFGGVASFIVFWIVAITNDFFGIILGSNPEKIGLIRAWSPFLELGIVSIFIGTILFDPSFHFKKLTKQLSSYLKKPFIISLKLFTLARKIIGSIFTLVGILGIVSWLNNNANPSGSSQLLIEWSLVVFGMGLFLVYPAQPVPTALFLPKRVVNFFQRLNLKWTIVISLVIVALVISGQLIKEVPILAVVVVFVGFFWYIKRAYDKNHSLDRKSMDETAPFEIPNNRKLIWTNVKVPKKFHKVVRSNYKNDWYGAMFFADDLLKEKERGFTYESYLASPEWNELRKETLRRADYSCERCHARNISLDVHHLTYTRFGHESLDDLASICRNCHDIIHEKNH